MTFWIQRTLEIDDRTPKLGLDLNKIQKTLETPVATITNARSQRGRDSKPLTRTITPYTKINNSSEILPTESSCEKKSKKSSTRDPTRKFEQSFEYWPSI